MNKILCIGVLGLLAATPVNAQELANRVNVIDGNNDFGWVLPAGVGGAVIQYQLNQPNQILVDPENPGGWQPGSTARVA